MVLFRNFYRYDRCGHEWSDDWSATCDDDCPECSARHMSPYQSEDIAEEEVTPDYSVPEAPPRRPMKYLILDVRSTNPAILTLEFNKCACCCVFPVSALILPNSACRGYRTFRRQIVCLILITSIWRGRKSPITFVRIQGNTYSKSTYTTYDYTYS
jgi:hypothetical protein